MFYVSVDVDVLAMDLMMMKKRISFFSSTCFHLSIAFLFIFERVEVSYFVIGKD